MSMVLRMDLNADIGELPDQGVVDGALMEYISSANVACGGHVGTAVSMERACRQAVDQDVVVGAQVSYLDPEGFGRRQLQVPPTLLAAQIDHQLQELMEAAARANTEVAYLKPHGALYHASLDDETVAAVVGELAANHHLSVLTMPAGALRAWCERHDVSVYREAFLDRGYGPSQRLLPRTHPAALLNSKQVEHRLNLWGSEGFAHADSLCIHSDTPDAVAIAGLAHRHLLTAQVRVQSFARSLR